MIIDKLEPAFFINVGAGRYVGHVVKQAIEAANEYRRIVVFAFNGRMYVARPGMTEDELFAQHVAPD